MAENHIEDEDLKRYRIEKQVKAINEGVPRMYQSGKMVNGVEIKHDACFGLNFKRINGNLTNIGEGHVLFAVGTSLALKDLNSKQTQFFHREGKFQNITALAGAQDEYRNIVIAAGESSPKGEELSAFATVIDIELAGKQKWLTINLNTKGHIQNMCLNMEKKPGTQLSHVFFWKYNPEKQLAMCTVKFPLEKISLHPSKFKEVLFTAPNYCRLWEVFFQEKVLKEAKSLLPLKMEKENRIIDHCWTTFGSQKYLIILLEKNRILIIHNDTVKLVNIDTSQISLVNENERAETGFDQDDYFDVNLDESRERSLDARKIEVDAHVTGDNKTIDTSNIELTCIAASKKGFLLGGTKGFLGSYELEKNYTFVNSSNFQLKGGADQRVIFCSINSGDSATTVVTTPSYANGEDVFQYYLVNMLQLDSGVSPTQPFYSLGFHDNKVLSLSTSRTRAIFASCGMDKFVRIWNYSEQETEEKHAFIAQQFKEDPLCVSLHPFGHFIAIAFGNCFKVFAILSDSLSHLTTTNLTLCRTVKYSKGGHFLVTNERYNVHVYDTIYYTSFMIFDEGHTAPIKDIVITDNDAGIISTDDNGAVFFWKLREERSERSNKFWEHRNNMYNKILYDTTNDLFFGCTAEKNLCVYSKNCKEKVCEFLAPDFDVRTAVISESKGVIFLGTNKGSIRILLWPIKKNTLEIEPMKGEGLDVFRYKYPEYFEITTHLTAISAMELSPDHNTLFVGSEDGTVLLFKVKSLQEDMEENKKLVIEDSKKKPEERFDFGALTNEVYLEKYSKLKEKSERIKKLQFEVLKSQQTVKIEGKKLELIFKNRIATINEEHEKTLAANSKKKEAFVAKSTAEYQTAYEQYMAEKAKYQAEREQTYKSNQKDEEFENFRNKELEDQIEKIKDDHKNNLKNLIAKNREEILKLRQFYQEKCEKVQFKYNQLTENARQYGSLFLDRMEKQEADAEREIDDKVKEIKDDILKEDEILRDLKSKNRNLTEENERLKREDTQQQLKINDLVATHNALKEAYIRINADIQKMEEQLIEREEVILSKEETCKAAKDEQLNLENFRYLLDQKIKTLSSDKHELLQQIDRQERHLKETFQELVKESNKNDDKNEVSKELENAIKVMQFELKKVDFDIFFTRNKISDLNNNIAKLVADKDNRDKWPWALKDILDRVSKSNDELSNKVQSKRDLTDEEIFDILQQAGEKAFNVNDELLRQAKWITKKLYLVNNTGKKLREVREENIQTVLKQNGKLIEECNTLRKENERLNNKLRNLEKIVNEGLKKKKRQDAHRNLGHVNSKSLTAIIRPTKLDNTITKSIEPGRQASDSEEETKKPVMFKNVSSENISTDISLRKPSNQQAAFSARKSDGSANNSLLAPKKSNAEMLNPPKIEEVPVELERAQSKEGR